jgi:hypothetical protein
MQHKCKITGETVDITFHYVSQKDSYGNVVAEHKKLAGCSSGGLGNCPVHLVNGKPQNARDCDFLRDEK